MARKKEPEKAANHERWLVSYADFITLLFAVFVTLYAMSQVDKKKIEEVAQSYRSAFGVVNTQGQSNKVNVVPQTDVAPIPTVKPPPAQAPRSDRNSSAKPRASHNTFRQMLVQLEKYLNEQKASDQVKVNIGTRGMVISLKEGGFFGSGSAVVKSSAFLLLAKIAQIIEPYDNPISFEGHTDNLPIHSSQFPSNWELSSARATNLAHYFIDYHSLSPQRIGVTGYGEFRPITANTSEEGRRENRRVDVVILGGDESDSVESAPHSPAHPANTLPPPF